MFKTIAKSFATLLALFTVFVFGGIVSLNEVDTKKVSAEATTESVTEIGITHVYYAGIHGAWAARPNRYMFDVAFNYDFSDTRDVTGCIYRFGEGVAYVNDIDVATQFAENDLWYDGSGFVDSDCTDANAFRIYVYADGDCSTFESLKFTKDFKFTLKGVTYQLDNDYEFVSYASLTNDGPVDGQGVMQLFKTEELDDALPEIKVIGMDMSGFRDSNNDFYVDITFDKAVMKSSIGWRKDTFLVNGQTPYIGKPGTANRSYPFTQFAEVSASMARVFLVGKASDYSTSLGYLNEIDSISILKGMKIQLADGTYAQVKQDYEFYAKETLTSENFEESEKSFTHKPLYDLYVAQTSADIAIALVGIETTYGYSMDIYELLSDKTIINEQVKGKFYLTAEAFKADYDSAIDTVLRSLIEEIAIPKEVKADITLPETLSGLPIVWSSSRENVIDVTGKVTRPKLGNLDKMVTLTANVSGWEMEFTVLVPAKRVERIELEKTAFGDVEQNGFIDFIGTYFTAYYDDETSEEIEVTPDLVSYQTNTIGEASGTLSYEGASLVFTYNVIKPKMQVQVPVQDKENQFSCSSLINYEKGGLIYGMILVAGTSMLLGKRKKIKRG